MPIFLVQGRAGGDPPDAGPDRPRHEPAHRRTRDVRLHRRRPPSTCSREAIGRPIDVVIVNTSRPSAATLARYAHEHKAPLEIGEIPAGTELVTRRVLVRRDRASRSAPAGAGGLGGARAPVVVTLLHLQQAALAFGHLPLFEGADLRIEAGERIALDRAQRQREVEPAARDRPASSRPTPASSGARPRFASRDWIRTCPAASSAPCSTRSPTVSACWARWSRTITTRPSGWRSSRTTPTRCQPSRGSSSSSSARTAGGSSRKSSS